MRKKKMILSNYLSLEETNALNWKRLSYGKICQKNKENPRSFNI